MSRLIAFLSFLLGVASVTPPLAGAEARPPNFVVIFLDDAGYADVGCFGARDFETPNLDRMAREGVRFTDFYVAQAVCSASRAAILTGCYPNRIGILGALGPSSRIALHHDEMTIAEVLKPKGYATAIYGKWHLGDHPEFLPTRHGFDEYFGLPYSNDMWPNHPTQPEAYPPLPLLEGTNVLERMPDQTQLTTRYTERAVRFIERHHTKPFFLYVAHSMPHVPLFVSDKFKGKSKQGLYGDVLMEIDWSVGQILEALHRHRLDEDTLVIFTSDNGPWLSYGNHAGRAEPLREGKGTSWEGGVREPCIMRWTGHIPAGRVCHEMAATIDLLPTVARLAKADLPPRPIDGLDIANLLKEPSTAKTPHQALFFYWNRGLESLRSDRWKLHFPHEFRTLKDHPGGRDGAPASYETARTGLALFDLKSDPGETVNVADQHPDVMNYLQALAERMREDLGDSLTQQQGQKIRQPGRPKYL